MTAVRSLLSEWTRRDFIRTGVATAGAVALGACARVAPSAPVSNGSGADLDELARRIRGRFLGDGSPLYEDARKVWNLAYDRRPLAMARCDGIDDVQRCVAFARRHNITSDGDVLELGPDRNADLSWAIRGGGGNFGVVTRLDFRLHPLMTQHRAIFSFGWNDIAGIADLRRAHSRRAGLSARGV